MQSVWVSCPWRLDGLVFAIEPNSQVRERELPAGVRVLLSIKAKETPALELPMKGAFQPWGIHILWGLQTDRRGPPFVAGAKSQSNQTCGRLGVEMRVRREEKGITVGCSLPLTMADSSKGHFPGIPSFHWYRFE